MAINFSKHESISLKDDPGFSENWLQDVIASDPSILGLGELDVIDRERVQEKSGRLDLLLSDGDSTRYEVELMLGQTDPSHIIRCIEYWDAERRRYPGYEHIAVLVAEDITSRFLNIISLMAGNIPMIAIQLNALQVGEHLVLNFVKVLDQTTLRVDDTQSGSRRGEVVDRDYWVKKVGGPMVKLAHDFFDFVKENCESQIELKYLAGRITISNVGDWKNLFVLYPKKQYVHVMGSISNREDWLEKFEEQGLPVSRKRGTRLQITITPREMNENKDILREFIKARLESSLADD